MPEFIIEHPTRGVFVGWKDSPTTGENYPSFNWSKPRNDESSVRYRSAEAAWDEIDRMPLSVRSGNIGVLLVPERESDEPYRYISRALPTGQGIEKQWVEMLAPIVVRHGTITDLINQTNKMIVEAACWRIRQIYPTAVKVVIAREDSSREDAFYVHHIVLVDGSTVSGIPDTVEEDDPLEEVQSLVGDLWMAADLQSADRIELDITEKSDALPS